MQSLHLPPHHFLHTLLPLPRGGAKKKRKQKTASESLQSRTLFLRNSFANHTHFAMRQPHVTHGSFEERGEAERVAQELNTQFLPHGVVVTGVTID